MIAADFKLPERFKNLTTALFTEWKWNTTVKDAKAPLTLANYDKGDCASMYLLYMQYPTEYEAALGILGSWSHWEKLCKCKWFKPYREKWEAERKIREEAIAKKALIEAAKKGNVNAARSILVDGDRKEKASRGRPSNKNAPSTAREDEELESIFTRFKVVEGSKEK